MKQKKSKKENIINGFKMGKHHNIEDDYDEGDININEDDVVQFSSDFDFDDDFFNDDSFDSSDSYLPLINRRNSGYSTDDFFDGF